MAADHRRDRRTRVRRMSVAVAVMAAVVLVDQLTKWWALTRLSSGPIHVIGTLDLELSSNTGASFSLFQGKAVFLIPIAVVLIGVLAAMAWRAPSAGRAAIFGLIVGGALGNLADRFFRGAPRCGRGLHRPALLAHLQRGRLVASWSAAPVRDLVGSCAAAAVSVVDGRGADVARRGPGRQGGGSGGRRVPIGGQCADRGRPGQDRRGVVRSRSTALACGQELRIDRDPAAGSAGTGSRSLGCLRGGLRGPRADRGGQAGRPGGPSRAPVTATGTLVNGLLARYPELAALPDAVGSDFDRPGIVHRLDRGTSGLMVVARTPAAYRLARRPAGRPEGVPASTGSWSSARVAEESGVVDAPVGRSVSAPTRMAVSRRGKAARTRYDVEGRFRWPGPGHAVTATLETGRTHQIRVHLSAIGHPVVGTRSTARSDRCPGHPVPALPPRRRAGLRPPGDRAGPMRWTSELPDDCVGQLAGVAERTDRIRAGTGRQGQAAWWAASSISLPARILEGLGLGLAHLPYADAQPLGRRLQRGGIVAVETEPVPDDLALEVGQPVRRPGGPGRGSAPWPRSSSKSLRSVDTRSPERGGRVGGGRLVEAGHHPRHLARSARTAGGGVGGVVHLLVGRAAAGTGG